MEEAPYIGRVKIAPTAAAAALLFPLAACGSSETPQAAPGAVERTVEALDRNEALERDRTVRTLHREEDLRAEQAERRIEAVESERTKQD